MAGLLKAASVFGLAAAFVIASLPACPCRGTAPAATSAGAHHCCAPAGASSLRTASCCDSHVAPAPAVSVAQAPSMGACDVCAPVTFDALKTLGSHPAPLPPPTVLRSSPILRV